MKRVSLKFIAISFTIMLIVCVGVMAYFAVAMTDKSNDAISKISSIYMENINGEISLHFKTTFDTNLYQLESMVDTDIKDYVDEETMLENLANVAKIRDFESLAFLGENGNVQMVYGMPINFVDIKPFMDSLNNSEKKVTISLNEYDNYSLVFGVSYDNYIMKNGEKSTALIASIPMSKFEKVLSLNDKNAITYTSIIRKNGDYIIKNYDDLYDNYFSRVEDFPDLEDKTADEYVSEIKSAIEKDESYSAVFLLGKERRHMYCSSLPNSEWYLVTIMPNGAIEDVMDDLNTQRTNLLLLGVFIIIVVFLILFISYYVRTSHQIAEIEGARTEAERANSAKSEFLSNMSHDIRTPMNAIVGMTAMAMANIDNRQKLTDCLSKIETSNKQLLGLINDILDMSKIESGKMTLNMDKVSLSELMEEILNIITTQMELKNQTLDSDIDCSISDCVYSDNTRLTQVIMNILSNAVKFTQSDGKIGVKLYQESSPEGNDYVRTHFIISDNGIGMSPEFQEIIYDSFTRADAKRVKKTEGTGLGMAITKHIVDAMAGTIQLKSELGVGTIFHITIDMVKAADDAQPINHRLDDNKSYDGIRLLVAEDNALNWEIANDLLMMHGFVADHAENGSICVDMLKNSQPGYYSAILMDIRMPVMSGYEATEQIRHLDHADCNIPIIAMSADAFSDDRQRCLDCGMNAHLPKPVDVNELIKTLDKYIID